MGDDVLGCSRQSSQLLALNSLTDLVREIIALQKLCDMSLVDGFHLEAPVSEPTLELLHTVRIVQPRDLLDPSQVPLLVGFVLTVGGTGQRRVDLDAPVVDSCGGDPGLVLLG